MDACGSLYIHLRLFVLVIIYRHATAIQHFQDSTKSFATRIGTVQAKVVIITIFQLSPFSFGQEETETCATVPNENEERRKKTRKIGEVFLLLWALQQARIGKKLPK
ncbi:hypothetical protein AVEN_81997-1 [Araneus ventricosus]|uniref:Secreted protein n=1 Tax=Araneus ventricosus TaxID=182803 RepID=A0A4Y2J239_ARAVE|nr:hypothetical protein AVEN_81997-1 [Araneus ventricosus]